MILLSGKEISVSKVQMFMQGMQNIDEHGRFVKLHERKHSNSMKEIFILRIGLEVILDFHLPSSTYL